MIEFVDNEIDYRDYCHGLWQMRKPFRFRWGDRLFKTPTGFVLDFYSIPRAFRWMFERNRGIGNRCALIHDFTVRYRLLLGLTLMDCHSMFLDAMQAMGIRGAKVKYFAVVVSNWAVAGDGDGKPGRDVRRAMRERGDDWRAEVDQWIEDLEVEL